MKTVSFLAIVVLLLNSLTLLSQSKDSLTNTNKLFQGQFVEYKKANLIDFNIDYDAVENVIKKLNSKNSVDILTKITQSVQYKKYILKYLKVYPKQDYCFGNYIIGLTSEHRESILTLFMEDLFKLYRELISDEYNSDSPIKQIEVYINLDNNSSNLFYATYGLKGKSYSNFELDKNTRLFKYKKNYIQLDFFNRFKTITLPIILNEKHIGFLVLFYEK